MAFFCKQKREGTVLLMGMFVFNMAEKNLTEKLTSRYNEPKYF